MIALNESITYLTKLMAFDVDLFDDDASAATASDEASDAV